MVEINSLSQRIVYDILVGEEFDVERSLGFVLTVIRDYCTCENTEKYLDLLLKRLWEKDFGKG